MEHVPSPVVLSSALSFSLGLAWSHSLLFSTLFSLFTLPSLSFSLSFFLSHTVARVAGGDAITDPHRIIFGVYSSLTFDIRSIAPPACSTNNKGTGLHEPAYFHWFILSITLCIWIPTLIIILYLSKYPTPTENHSSSHCHTCTTALQSNCCQSVISKLLTFLTN